MRYTRMIIFLLLFVLSGCFQQAGEVLQPASSTEIPISVQNSGNTNSLSLTQFPATATLPPITMIAPTKVLPQTIVTRVMPTLEQTLTPVVEGQFRTPISPLGPVTPIMPTPSAPSGQAFSTPSGMITPTALPGADNAENCTHTVQPGETLYRIALSLDISLEQLRAANPQVPGDLIQPGDVLKVPGCQPDSNVANDSPAPDSAVSGGEDTGEVTPASGGTLYTVKPGDTLYAIAQRNGVTVQAIVEANNLSNPNSLSIGQEIVIPPASG